jgi:hypothetical protein
MSLKVAAETGPRPIDYHRRGCALGRWARTLPPDEQAALTHLMTAVNGHGQRLWTDTNIRDRINADDDYPDIQFGIDVVRRHRKGACGCER